MGNISDIKGAYCNHYYNGKFMFDPSDPESRCPICGALCKDIFHVCKYED